MKRGVAILTVIAIILVFGLHLTGFIGSSRARVERDHSVRLPQSASNFNCFGFISLSWLWDSGESATFSVSSTDLEGIFSQFRKSKSVNESETFRGISRDGNIAVITITSLPDGAAQVQISTAWN